MKFEKTEKYDFEMLKEKIMGPNPLKLTEELLEGNKTHEGAIVMDLGSGNGITSVFLAKEYGYKVYAADLWSDPSDNLKFFKEMGLSRDQIVPIKADANNLPFANGFFDAIVSIDSYHYYGMNTEFLDAKLLPVVKNGGYVYIVIPGMKKDYQGNYPAELLLSWTPEQLETIKDLNFWRMIVSNSINSRVEYIGELDVNEEAWRDWLKSDNPYAVGDRAAIEAGGWKYMNFIAIILKKHMPED